MKSRGDSAILWVLVIGMLVGFSLPHMTFAKEEVVRLHGNLGRHHFRISTPIPMAQRYFDQGMILMYGFNHAEAARSFQYAQKLDPTCAMCFWGEALVLGPNINAPMADTAVVQAWAAVEQARVLAKETSEKEQALIEAVAKRYAQEVMKDRSSLDQAYAEAMRQVVEQFPEDPVIGALLSAPVEFLDERRKASTLDDRNCFDVGAGARSQSQSPFGAPSVYSCVGGFPVSRKGAIQCGSIASVGFGVWSSGAYARAYLYPNWLVSGCLGGQSTGGEGG